ncbi:MAG: MBOAT family protein [Lyngbya sp.]|nr:MBOAT family protein [Lyngbya sp.]
MLFNSPEFIFFFMPIVLLVFFFIGHKQLNIVGLQLEASIFWLVCASLFFYGWWNPPYLILIVISIAFNYICGSYLSHHLADRYSSKKLFLVLGVCFNLALIGYYKYANFFLSNINHLIGYNISISSVILPLGISFYTFQQIAYLVDAYRGETKEYNFLNYSLFVTFFPQLIAGPIVHHKDILHQFRQDYIYRFSSQCLSIGLTVFIAGLFKKVVFADRIAAFSTPVFAAASQGVTLTFSEAWAGALAYTLQLYFDFSGYSDMAIGIAYMFGIRLPLNFDSPYKAVSIVDFWRRWHITLSNFLRDYLYIPLGGNRKGKIRRHINLMMTMLLGGLWHGAGWTFIFWGGLHGVYLVINHQYRSFRRSIGQDTKQDGWFLRGIGWLVTFLAVMVSWIFFRADSFQSALSILSSMIGLNGISLPEFWEPYLSFMKNWGVDFQGFTVNVGISQKYAVFGITCLLLVAWFTPNTQQWMGKYSPALTPPSDELIGISNLWKKIQWQPNKLWSSILGLITAVTLLGMTRVSEFLYFQF